MVSLVGAWVLLPAVVLIGGLIGATGIGGVLLVPALTAFGEVPLAQAIAAASLGFALPGFVALAPMCKQRPLMIRAIPLLLGALAGAAVGALAVRWLSANVLMAGVTVLVLVAGWRGLQPAGVIAATIEPPSRIVLLALGSLVGLASALTGTGGPVILLPLLMLMRQPVIFAVAAAQIIQLPVALASGAVHAFDGRLDFTLALTCGVFMLAGSIAGQRAAARLDVREIQRAVSILLLALGGWFLWIQVGLW